MFRHLAACAVILLAVLAPAPALPVGFSEVGTFAFQFELFPIDARSEALAEADLAATSGPAGLWRNPAPLPEGHTLQLAHGYLDWVAGVGLASLSLAAESNGWRFGICRASLLLDPQSVRTAYNPEGDGPTFDYTSRIHVVGASRDLAPLLFPGNENLTWSLGASWRHYYSRLAELSVNAWDLDLGSTVRWRTSLTDGWLAMRAAGMVHNLLGKTIDSDGLETHLPHCLRLGVALEGGHGRRGPGRDTLQWLVAFTISEPLGEPEYPLESEHFGVEVKVLDLVAMRGGYDSQRPGDGDWSYGCGLILRPEGGPLGVTLDYTSIDSGRFFGGWREFISMGLQVGW